MASTASFCQGGGGGTGMDVVKGSQKVSQRRWCFKHKPMEWVGEMGIFREREHFQVAFEKRILQNLHS